jgi:nucleoporin POM152
LPRTLYTSLSKPLRFYISLRLSVADALPSSAVLNPQHKPFCLGQGNKFASIPIQFNASIPAEIEIIRIDLDSNYHDSIKISKSDVRKIAKGIRALEGGESGSAVYTWEYQAKTPGVYRLGTVLDEYKLEVQRLTKDTYVVPCPKASIRSASSSERCIRDLSDLSLDVVGTPPLKIVYSRTINGKDRSFHFQSLQPDDFSSPMLSSPVTMLQSSDQEDISWVKPRPVTVRLNETMGSSGEWQYTVDEVHDVFGNVVNYAQQSDDLDLKPKPKQLVQNFIVKERPHARLDGCDLRRPLKVAKGKRTKLPVSFSIAGAAPDDTSHTLTWEFSPIDSLTNSGDHGDKVSMGSYFGKNSHDRPGVSEPGLYTLKTISSGSCDGEVREPSSCLLLNALEPQLAIRAEPIPDKCAGNSIGLRVDLDLIGTPPFIVRYNVETGNTIRTETLRISSLRQQIELLPKEAGKHKYIFKSLDDAFYQGQDISGPEMVLEQDVKPPTSATIIHPPEPTSVCLESEVEVDIHLRGDGPLTLEWEIVHEGKRRTFQASGIEGTTHKIKTEPLAKGGEYILALNSVRDKTGCRTFLKDELKISVRRQRPRAAFGLVEGKRTLTAVEDTPVKLPLRLQGEGPWEIAYKSMKEGSEIIRKRVQSSNDNLVIKEKGIYEIVDVYDKCPGIVDPQASRFEVDWFPRPEISLVPIESISPKDSEFVKRDVCEGDIDGFEINLKGRSPPAIVTQARFDCQS